MYQMENQSHINPIISYAKSPLHLFLNCIVLLLFHITYYNPPLPHSLKALYANIYLISVVKKKTGYYWLPTPFYTCTCVFYQAHCVCALNPISTNEACQILKLKFQLLFMHMETGMTI